MKPCWKSEKYPISRDKQVSTRRLLKRFANLFKSSSSHFCGIIITGKKSAPKDLDDSRSVMTF